MTDNKIFEIIESGNLRAVKNYITRFPQAIWEERRRPCEGLWGRMGYTSDSTFSWAYYQGTKSIFRYLNDVALSIPRPEVPNH